METSLILDIITFAICAIIVFIACKRGFVKSFFKFSKVILSILTTYLLRDFAAGICEKLFVKGWFEGTISGSLVDKVRSEGATSFDSLFDSLGAAKGFVPRDELQSTYEAAALGSAEDAAFELGTKIEGSLISMLSMIIGCVLMFVISLIVFAILAKILEKVVKLPALKQLDKFLGFLWGLAYAYVLLGMLTSISSIFIDPSLIENTVIFKFFYEHGLFTGLY